jgi:hypothetical protein
LRATSIVVAPGAFIALRIPVSSAMIARVSVLVGELPAALPVDDAEPAAVPDPTVVALRVADLEDELQAAISPTANTTTLATPSTRATLQVLSIEPPTSS